MRKLCSAMWFATFCLSLAVAAPAAAQEIALGGTVADETGGVLPGVTVTALHVDSGNTFLGVSDVSGGYRIGALRTGVYNVSAELSGFATQLQEQVELLVGQTAVIDFTMTISALEETITVTGAAPLIDVQQSNLGGNVDSRQMEALPVNGRSWMQLTTLAPGSRVNSTQSSSSPSGRWATDFQVNLDGQPVSQSYSVASLGQPRFSRDAIAEFEVVSSRFDATQGRSTGIQVNAVTKSGTNTFTGSLAGYFRHDKFNAKDFFADRVLPYSNRQISGTFGGPMVTDRVHFFGYVEDESEPRSLFFTSLVPEFNALGNGPDGTGLQDTRTSRLYGARVDAQLTDSTRLMVRGNGWVSDELHRPERSLANHPSTLMDKDYSSRQFYGTLTRSSGRTVNELKVGHNNFVWDNQSYWGIRSPEIRLAGLSIGPSFVTNGSNQTQDIISVRDDFTMLRGGHTLKIGGEFMLPSYYVYVPAERDGVLFAQAGAFPANIAELFPSNDPSTWNLGPLSPITQRWAQTSGRYDVHAANCDDPGPTPGERDPDNGCYRKKPTYSWWVQDDWRVTRNLTLNLGLRWDFAQDIMANDIDLTSLRAPQFANDPVRTGAPQEWTMFQPRIGFAYALNDNRTVVRGGWGLYYSGMNDVSAIHTEFPLGFLTFENLNDGRPDFASNPFGHLPGGRQPTHQEVVDGANAGLYRLDISSYGPITLDDSRIPYSHQSTIGFQQQSGDTMSFQADYVNIAMRRGRYPINANLTYDPETGVNRPYSDPSTRRWPDLGLVRVYDHGKSTTYSGLETSFTKRFSQGWQLSATYTLGRSEACSPSPVDGAFPVARDLGDDCWNATEGDGGPPDQRHRAVFNGIWDLPYDFQVSGLYFFGSGQRYDSYTVFDLRDTGGFFVPWAASAQRLQPDGSIIDHGDVKGNPIHRVDMRLQRRIGLGRAHVDLMLEVFNLFNRENSGNYQKCTCAPTYATPLASPDIAYWPRMVQLAFRLAF